MIPLPNPPESQNIRALAKLGRERYTGLTTTIVTLNDAASEGLEMVHKNGTLLDPNGGTSGYAISGKTITLGAAAIAGDVFVIWYYARGVT